MFALPVPDYESHPKYRPLLERVDEALRAEALASFLPPFQKLYRRRLQAPPLDYEGRIGEGDALLRALQQSGCATWAIPADAKARLVELTAPVARAIEARLELGTKLRFKHSQQKLDPAEHAEAFRAAGEILRAGHVQAAAEAYVGAPLVLRELTVQVNTARATAAQHGPIGEDGLPSPRTRYFHIDSAVWPPVKVLIYLTPVGPDQGPFRYVEGSHRWAGDFELAVRKVNDREAFPGELFMALPPALRLHTLFGDDMDPDGEAARRLLAHERAVCDGDGDLMLFDFNGVHRGGFVRQGRRWMLQCYFEPAA